MFGEPKLLVVAVQTVPYRGRATNHAGSRIGGFPVFDRIGHQFGHDQSQLQRKGWRARSIAAPRQARDILAAKPELI
jgi:hypothetical protein